VDMQALKATVCADDIGLSVSFEHGARDNDIMSTVFSAAAVIL